MTAFSNRTLKMSMAVATLVSGTAFSALADNALKVPAALKDKGSVTIGTSVGYPPYVFYDTDGKTLLGYEPELHDLWTSKLKIKGNWKSADWASLFSGLQSQRYDVLMVGIKDTKERQEKYTIVDYAMDGWTVLYAKGNSKGINTADSLCGLKVAAVAQTSETNMKSISADCENKGKKPLSISVFNADTQGLLALSSGRVDAVSVQTPSGAYYVKQNPDKYELLDRLNLAPGLVGIVLPKEQTELAEAYQAAIQSSIDDGSYAKIMDKWGMTSLAIKKASINGQK
jgi:polar amino acid transport system substrate-binding protein